MFVTEQIAQQNYIEIKFKSGNTSCCLNNLLNINCVIINSCTVDCYMVLWFLSVDHMCKFRIQTGKLRFIVGLELCVSGFSASGFLVYGNVTFYGVVNSFLATVFRL